MESRVSRHQGVSRAILPPKVLVENPSCVFQLLVAAGIFPSQLRHLKSASATPRPSAPCVCVFTRCVSPLLRNTPIMLDQGPPCSSVASSSLIPSTTTLVPHKVVFTGAGG